MSEPISIERLSRDLASAAITLSDQEARFLVDSYYIMQKARLRGENQIRAMTREPHALLAWLTAQDGVLEAQIKRALDRYTRTKPIGEWLRAVHGIGPVISAGLMAHIDIARAPDCGHIWNFAGLNPRKIWRRGEKRPWNTQLKTICWKAGDSFVKFSGAPECYYGAVYRERKAWEVARNDGGGNAAAARGALDAKDYSRETGARAAYLAGKLPPAHVEARARRYAVKRFLAHLHAIWHWMEFSAPPAVPYIIAHSTHHDIELPPHMDVAPGFEAAARAAWKTRPDIQFHAWVQ